MLDGVQAAIAPRDGFDPENFLQGPSPYVFELEDALQIDSLCSITGVTLTISGVMLGADLEIKPFSFTHAPNTNRTLNTTRQHIGSGWLLRVRILATAGAPLVGQCFVWLRLCRGLTAAAVVNGFVVSGYVTASKDIAYPGSPATAPLDEEGAARSILVTQPAAGADWSQTVPTGARWEVTGLAALFTTAVAVANRAARLFIDDGANIVFEVPNPAVQAASLAVVYTYGQGAGGPITSDATIVEAPIPNDLYLTGGMRLRSSTGLIQAADQWSAIVLLVREWLEGN